MKTSNLIIRIPEPCHEDWNKMEPDTKGKFCNSCSKSVIDFSNKTDLEIKDILLEHKGQKVCGHFKKTQIDRPLNIRIDFNNLPKNVSTTKAFAIALFFVFGTFLFSCTTLDGKKVDTIEVVNNHKEDYVEGEIAAKLEVKDTTILKKLPLTECSLETVDGGIRVEEVIVDVPKIEEVHTLGMMVYIPEVADTLVPVIDSSTTNKKIIEEPIITNKQTELEVYPNPSTGEFTIKYDVLKRADVRLDIYNMAGALLKTVVNVNKQFEGKYQIPVNLNNLPTGVYIVNLTNDGKRVTQKVVIEK
ncbi:MAG: T9SS type A sorting domain-containing protein [Bacteroidota bacterium]|nr:T9SS type A sorting domain-containing protein [Bacteroidota bacterium]